MTDSFLPTEFASAERAEAPDLQSQRAFLERYLGKEPLLDSISDVLVILNEHRQVIFSNKRLLELLDTTLEDVLGKRTGEVLGCVHSDETSGGCGTTESCRECGAVQAILKAQTGEQSVKECRILTHGGGALDLRVWATPMMADGREFTVFSASDISHEKRRQALERIFFHDILNTAGNVLGATQLLQTRGAENPGPILGIIQRASSQLVEEIQSHRLLLSAEQGTLEAGFEDISSLSLLGDLKVQYQSSGLGKGREIALDAASVMARVRTDPVLLSRVIGNLLKNALEATPEGGVVNLACRPEGEWVVFSVNNPGVMDRSTQLQVFQRSFSTKGAGRGIGTFSVKLLTEQYLEGEVWFESEEGEGTTFFVRLPASPGIRPGS